MNSVILSSSLPSSNLHVSCKMLHFILTAYKDELFGCYGDVVFGDVLSRRRFVWRPFVCPSFGLNGKDTKMKLSNFHGKNTKMTVRSFRQ